MLLEFDNYVMSVNGMLYQLSLKTIMCVFLSKLITCTL